MKDNNIKQILDGSQITDEIKKLMETEQLCCDDHDNFDGELLNKIIELCESSGKIKPKSTVAILEELLLNSEFLPNTYFMDRYVYCLTCSCNDQDEDYIQNAVHKIRLIIENIDDINLALFMNKYIECTSILIKTQESGEAEQTILELKHFCDKTNAWENPDVISAYKSALYDLHEIQCHAGDTQAAVDSLNEIISIVHTYDDIY
jgi:hypothetical protein